MVVSKIIRRAEKAKNLQVKHNPKASKTITLSEVVESYKKVM